MIEKIAFAAARTGLGGIFLVSGWAKVVDVGGFAGYAAAYGMPFPEAAVVAAAMLELAAGLALVAGWRLVVATAALAAFSLVTAVIFHADFADPNESVHFWKNVAIAGGLAHIGLAGWLRSRRPERALQAA